ncbi:uncharacterized protein LOC128190686 [Crassostrea angulata]|uniref:uncharacterized protein LOC128190686 n=1 Tax=Magallana angulata TaxID=2784310 RepID=UPI0022B1A8E5|nr:uncharacterized protein LOC128190686 [Crassostrea angulata]
MSMSLLLYIKAFVLNVMICHYAVGNLLNSPLVKEVEECPMNETLWTEKSKEICNNTQDTPYHCLPIDSLNGSVEGCLQVKTIQSDYCAIYNTFSNTAVFGNISSCKGKTNFSCPITAYSSNEIYRYPSCLKINPLKRCYLDDPTCPNVVSNGEGFTNTWQLPLLMLLLWSAVDS